MSTEALIFDALRTPRGKGKAQGSLHEVKPVNLVSGLLKTLANQNELDTSQVDDVVLGCVTPIGDQGGNIAKTAVMAAGWDEKVAGFQANRFCASGLEAVNLAAMKIRSGWEDLVVAGGVECMSRVGMGHDGGPWAMDPETSIKAGFVPQGIGADLIATIEGFSREDVDTFALESHRRASRAWEDGRFTSIVPVVDANGLVILNHDETVRKDASMEVMSSLKASFEMPGSFGFDDVALQKYHFVEKINHVHTAANSSGIVDGAAVLLMGSEAKGRELGLKARGRVVAAAITSTDPTIMLTGPAPATRKVLAKARMKVSDIDLFEVNEAFAAVVMKFSKDMNISMDKINVNGGAIAMGHPLGATGAMITGAMLDELERQNLTRGLITLCVGGGMGIATIIERV